MISLIVVLLSLVIWGLIFSILWWAIGVVGMSEPFHKVAVAILVIASVVIAIGLLMGSIAPFPFLALSGI